MADGMGGLWASGNFQSVGALTRGILSGDVVLLGHFPQHHRLVIV